MWKAQPGTSKVCLIKHHGEKNYYAVGARAVRVKDMRGGVRLAGCWLSKRDEVGAQIALAMRSG